MVAEFERARAAIERVAHSGDTGDGDSDLREFLDVLARGARGDLEVSNPDWQQFLDATTDAVRALRRPLHSFIAGFETWLNREFFADDWVTAVERRSQIEFLRDAYLSRLGEDPDRWMDPYNLDEMLRTAGNLEGHLPPDRLPRGTPGSHWWWWLPGTPPP